jgi:hypothetical protein
MTFAASFLPTPVHQAIAPAVALMVALSSCSDPMDFDATSASNTEPDLIWEPAPDNSYVNSFSFENISTIRRCWKRGAMFECLAVSATGQNGTAQRYQTTRLTRRISDEQSPWSTPGYKCAFFGSSETIEEGVVGTGDWLIKQTIVPGAMSPAWSRIYVVNFMQSNGIEGEETYFDCSLLASKIFNASVDTVGTTNVTYGEIIQQ